MRHLTPATALALGAGLLLSACTSEDPGTATPDTPSGTGGTATGSPTEAGVVPEGGWYCSLIDDDMVTEATGDDLASARERMISNDLQSWECEVTQVGTDGSAPALLRLTGGPVEEAAAEELRAGVADAPGVTRGPEYLGEGYIAPGRVVSLMDCNSAPQDGRQGAPTPHAFTFEVLSGPLAQSTEELTSPVRRLVTEVDRATGCFPADAYAAAGATG